MKKIIKSSLLVIMWMIIGISLIIIPMVHFKWGHKLSSESREVAMAAGGGFVGCVTETDNTSGEMLTHTCAGGAYAISGSCWRNGSGTFIGDQLGSDGKSYACRWEGGAGLKMTVKCCK